MSAVMSRVFAPLDQRPTMPGNSTPGTFSVYWGAKYEGQR